MRRPGGRRPRRLRRLALVALAAVAALVAAPTAYASVAAPFSSCTQPPEAAAANEVVGGHPRPGQRRPARARHRERAGPRPPARPATTQLDLWGWTGFAWPDYDPGSSFGSCTLGQAGHLEDSVVGFVARAQLETLVWASAATTGVARAAYDPHRYDVLAGLEGTIRDGLGDGVAKVLFPLGGRGGRRLARRHRRPAQPAGAGAPGRRRRPAGRQRDARRACGRSPWARASTTRSPRRSPGSTRRSTAPRRTATRAARSARACGPTWWRPPGGTARSVRSTPRPRRASRTGSAAQLGDQQPGARGPPGRSLPSRTTRTKLSTAMSGLADSKAQAYDKVAAELKAQDPRAYLTLAGSHNDRRLWGATIGWISFWGVAAVQWLASVLSIWCLVILRLIIQAWPAVALIGLLRPRAAGRILGIAVGAVVADLGVSAVAAVERVAMGAILGWQADGGGIAAIILSCVVAAISLWACWPFVRCVPGMPRRIRQLGTPFVGGRDPAALPADDRPALEPGTSRPALPADAAAGAPGQPGRRACPADCQPRRRRAVRSCPSAPRCRPAPPRSTSRPSLPRHRSAPRRPPRLPLPRTATPWRSRRGRPCPPPSRLRPSRRAQGLGHVDSPPRRNHRWSLPSGPRREPVGGRPGPVRRERRRVRRRDGRGLRRRAARCDAAVRPAGRAAHARRRSSRRRPPAPTTRTCPVTPAQQEAAARRRPPLRRALAGRRLRARPAALGGVDARPRRPLADAVPRGDAGVGDPAHVGRLRRARGSSRPTYGAVRVTFADGTGMDLELSATGTTWRVAQYLPTAKS